MVQRILSFLHKEIRGLHEAAYLLAFFALLSQILALVRDRLLAYQFGAGATLDIYYAAFRIPDLIFISVGSLVSVSVLVPFLLDRTAIGNGEVKLFVSRLFTFFLGGIVVVNTIVFFFVPALTSWLFPGILLDRHDELVLLTRILLLSPLLLGISNCLGSVTQAYKRFAVYALSPLLYNLGIIFGIVVLYPSFGLMGLAFGVVFGAILHLFVQVPSVQKTGLLPSIVFSGSWRVFTEVMVVSLPRTLTLGLSQIATIFLLSLASKMTEGSIAVFTLAFNLQSVPLAIIGVSYSLAAFPALSKLHGEGDRSTFFNQLATAARHILFWSIPIMVLFVVLRAQIVRVILGAGNFSWSDTRLTAAALALFAVSTVAQSLTLLFVRAYYARGNTKKPLILTVVSTLLIVVFALLFKSLFTYLPDVRYFMEALLRVDAISGTEILVLPLSFTLGMWINAVVLWWGLKAESPVPLSPLRKTFFESFSASIIMGFVTYLALTYFGSIFPLRTVGGIFLQGFCAGIIGIVVAVCILRLLRSPELSDVWKTLHAKIWKVPVVAEEAREL